MDANNKVHIATEITFYERRMSDYFGYIMLDGKQYEFLVNGYFYVNGDKQLLKIVESSITKTTGTKLVRETSSDGTSNARPFPRYGIATASETGGTEESDKTEEIFSISTLQPREEVAASCLQAMLQKYENPLNIDNTKIKQLVSKSYLFAQEFINQAVLYREKETTSATVENNKYASVDSDSLSSDTDKLLYNIATAINNFIAQDKNQYADQQKNGLKLAATDVNVKTLPESININAAVTGSVTTKQESTSSGT
nr:MAG TPA: hypothetical protein [Caudoviricetes sp.]